MDTARWTLDVIDIASPCTAAWTDMRGGDRVRRCEECQLNVYNVSDMTRTEAEELVRNAEGRLCVRFFRRGDGTVLTADCPVGLRGLRRRAARLTAGIAAMVAAILCGSWTINHSRGAGPQTDGELVRGPLAQFVDWLDPPMPCFMGFAINRPRTPVFTGDIRSTTRDADAAT